MANVLIQATALTAEFWALLAQQRKSLEHLVLLPSVQLKPAELEHIIDILTFDYEQGSRYTNTTFSSLTLCGHTISTTSGLRALHSLVQHTSSLQRLQLSNCRYDIADEATFNAHVGVILQQATVSKAQGHALELLELPMTDSMNNSLSIGLSLDLLADKGITFIDTITLEAEAQTYFADALALYCDAMTTADNAEKTKLLQDAAEKFETLTYTDYNPAIFWHKTTASALPSVSPNTNRLFTPSMPAITATTTPSSSHEEGRRSTP